MTGAEDKVRKISGWYFGVVIMALLLGGCESPQSATLRKYQPEIERVLTTGQIGTYAYESKNTSPNCIQSTYDSLVKLAQAPDSFATAIMLLTPDEIDTIAGQDPVQFYDKFLRKTEDAPQRFTVLNAFVQGDFIFVNSIQEDESADPLPARMTTLAFEVVDGRLAYYPPRVLAISNALAATVETEQEPTP